MHNVFAIAKRELKSYFGSPLAYVFIIVFLVMVGIFTFLYSGILERGEATLSDTFFFWHPFCFMILAPAIGMRLWSEEQRQGTLELLLTMPVAPWQAIFGKFLASVVVIFVTLLLTFPVVGTLMFLGNPDIGAIVSGYLGSLLLGSSFLAITVLISAFTRSQVVCFVVATVICVIMTLIGHPVFVDFLRNTFKPWAAEAIASLTAFEHYNEFTKGLILARDVVFFLALIFFCLFTTSVVLRGRRG